MVDSRSILAFCAIALMRWVERNRSSVPETYRLHYIGFLISLSTLSFWSG
ncbi:MULTISPECIES: hypothetical protein [Aerosakkonema]